MCEDEFYFHMKGFTQSLSLCLKQRLKVAQKWPATLVLVL